MQTAAAGLPSTKLIDARRRIVTMIAQLPPSAWTEPSAIADRSRKDCLAQLAADGARDHRFLRAILAGDPVRDDGPETDPSDTLNARAGDSRRDKSVDDLAAELAADFAMSLSLLAQLDGNQVMQPAGAKPHVLGTIESQIRHEHATADDIVNGPRMPRF